MGSGIFWANFRELGPSTPGLVGVLVGGPSLVATGRSWFLWRPGFTRAVSAHAGGRVWLQTLTGGRKFLGQLVPLLASFSFFSGAAQTPDCRGLGSKSGTFLVR